VTLEDFLARFGSGLTGESLLALGVAVLAGVTASAVCPCTLPMGLGMAGVVGASEIRGRSRGLAIALAFFAGIVVNLTMLGAVAGRMGAVLTESFGRYWTLAMAAASLLAAVLAFYGPRLGAEKIAALRMPGVGGAFGYGFIFSLGTSAAPLLLLLTISLAQAKPIYGLLLAFAFGVGRGLPFLLLGVFAGALMRLTRLRLWDRAIQVVSGVALLLVSLYYARAFVSLA
jgi:cytochrome c-type biogenesis protein